MTENKMEEDTEERVEKGTIIEGEKRVETMKEGKRGEGEIYNVEEEVETIQNAVETLGLEVLEDGRANQGAKVLGRGNEEKKLKGGLEKHQNLSQTHPKGEKCEAGEGKLDEKARGGEDSLNMREQKEKDIICREVNRKSEETGQTFESDFSSTRSSYCHKHRSLSSSLRLLGGASSGGRVSRFYSSS